VTLRHVGSIIVPTAAGKTLRRRWDIERVLQAATVRRSRTVVNIGVRDCNEPFIANESWRMNRYVLVRFNGKT
jgi:hypothetical protein